MNGNPALSGAQNRYESLVAGQGNPGPQVSGMAPSRASQTPLGWSQQTGNSTAFNFSTRDFGAGKPVNISTQTFGSVFGAMPQAGMGA